MSPIYQAPIVVPASVLAEEAAILAQEGSFHVRGIYFASAQDANTARRVEAERRVDASVRAVRLALTCPWCDTTVRSANAVEIGGRNLHPACATEYDTQQCASACVESEVAQ